MDYISNLNNLTIFKQEMRQSLGIDTKAGSKVMQPMMLNDN